MVTSSDSFPLPGIAALPPTTVRQLGSGQVLTDPSSVVKELIDNALDGRAKSIFVDITTNAIDSIQVKDDGHGIPCEDRPLVCRRYCTSKIRDFHDLQEVGGRWLGFRGEALSSMAEMSGTLSVTTRVEGEPVAARMEYERNGELTSTVHESHPVGTTVKITRFFEHTPVRKQTTLKNSAKVLGKTRRLLQAYALARPNVRFRLRIVKALNNRGDFVYAPKLNGNVEDAVLKIFGKECALQCDWTTIESDGFEVYAFLPKPNALATKITNQGTFVSIDGRPVSSSKGTTKLIVAAFKAKLRKANSSLNGAKDPILCMNIKCPPDSYDPNIEPAKDDVMFENSEAVLTVVRKLLDSYYPQFIEPAEDLETIASTQQSPAMYETDRRDLEEVGSPVHVLDPSLEIGDFSSDSALEQPRWRSSMYGVDEEDLEHIAENGPPLIEQEDGARAVSVSNPWTIARMNATQKPTSLFRNGQLLSPTRSQPDTSARSSSPLRSSNLQVTLKDKLSTPRVSSRDVARSQINTELESSFGCLNPPTSRHYDMVTPHASSPTRVDVLSTGVLRQSPADTPVGEAESGYLSQSPQRSPQQKHASSNEDHHTTRNNLQFGRSNKTSFKNKPFVAPKQNSNDAWFGQPMKGPAQAPQSRCSKQLKAQNVPLLQEDYRSTIQEPSFSQNSTDIRNFFNTSHEGRDRLHYDLPQTSSFTPINMPASTAGSTAIEPVTGKGRRKVQRASSVGSQSSMLFNMSQCVSVNGMSLPQYHQGARLQLQNGATPNVYSSRPVSAESQPSLLHSKGFQRTTARPDSDTRPSNIAQEMDAYFDAVSLRESTSPLPSSAPAHNLDPIMSPPHKNHTVAQTIRPRGTNALEHTRSSTSALECTPHSFLIQDMILRLNTNLTSILHSSMKLDMRANNTAYYAAGDDAHKAFAQPILEQRIRTWVMAIDAVLCERFGRTDGVDSRCLLHEGIQRALDTRWGQTRAPESKRIDPPCTTHGAGVRVLGDICESSDAVSEDFREILTAGTESERDFDMSEFVHMEAGQMGKGAMEQETEHGGTSKDEFDEDMEDEMLMGL
ncbi:hypothetical protein ACN47E_002969 [Coniothyrium glycines]